MDGVKEYKFVFLEDELASGIFEMLERQVTLAGYSVKPEPPIQSEDIYFDSEQMDLQRMGIAYRVRRSEKGVRAEIKRSVVRPGGETVYLVHEQSLPEDCFAKACHGTFVPLGELRAALLPDDALRPVLHLRNERKVLSLLWGACRVGALHLDRFETFYPQASGEALGTFYEIELKGKEDRHLIHIGSFLSSSLKLIPVTLPKIGHFSHAIDTHRGSASPRRVILDMDPGVDDALALILALRSPEVQVEAISVVGGNVPVERCAQNVLRVLSFLERTGWKGKRPSVARGLDLPDRRADASGVHGRDGLGEIDDSKYGIDWPDTSHLKDITEVIPPLLLRNPKEITIVATGPCSNLARLIDTHPDALALAREIVVMGGVFFDCGNRSPAAEFNWVRLLFIGTHLVI